MSGKAFCFLLFFFSQTSKIFSQHMCGSFGVFSCQTPRSLRVKKQKTFARFISALSPPKDLICFRAAGQRRRARAWAGYPGGAQRFNGPESTARLAGSRVRAPKLTRRRFSPIFSNNQQQQPQQDAHHVHSCGTTRAQVPSSRPTGRRRTRGGL